MWIFVVYLKD